MPLGLADLRPVGGSQNLSAVVSPRGDQVPLRAVGDGVDDLLVRLLDALTSSPVAASQMRRPLSEAPVAASDRPARSRRRRPAPRAPRTLPAPRAGPPPESDGAGFGRDDRAPSCRLRWPPRGRGRRRVRSAGPGPSPPRRWSSASIERSRAEPSARPTRAFVSSGEVATDTASAGNAGVGSDRCAVTGIPGPHRSCRPTRDNTLLIGGHRDGIDRPAVPLSDRTSDPLLVSNTLPCRRLDAVIIRELFG